MNISPANLLNKTSAEHAWQLYHQALKAFIQKRIKDSDVADDILSEVLERVYQSSLKNTEVKNIKSWLFQIAQNCVIDHWNKQKRYLPSQELPEIPMETEETVYHEAENYILPLINLLPEEYAVPLRLSDIENWKQSDIAQHLNLSLSATKSRIQRARDLLKAEFISCCRFKTNASGKLISFEVKDHCIALQKVKADIGKATEV